MDASALLFRDRNCHRSLARISQTQPDVLEVVGDSILKGERLANKASCSLSPVLGASPNLSPRLQKSSSLSPMFRTSGGGRLQPFSGKELLSRIPKRIREGDKSIRFLVSRDQKAPREAWELALAPKESDVLGEFSRNKSAPADLLSKVAEAVIQSDPVGLAANPGHPARDFETAFPIPRLMFTPGSRKANAEKIAHFCNPNRWPATTSRSFGRSTATLQLPEAVERVLRTLATCTAANIRDTCPDDPRLPQDLIEKLSKDPSIQVRIVLSMNPSVPLPILEKLAEDPYQMVSERARNNMKERFPDAWAAHEKKGAAQELNPNNDLSQDIAGGHKIWRRRQDARAARVHRRSGYHPPSVGDRVDDSANHFEPFKALLKEAVTEGGSAALETMITYPKLTPDELHWLADEHLLNQQMTDRFAFSATESGRNRSYRRG